MAEVLTSGVAESCLRISSLLNLVDVLRAVAIEAQVLTGSDFAGAGLIGPGPTDPEIHLAGISEEEFTALIQSPSQAGTRRPELQESGDSSDEVTVQSDGSVLQASVDIGEGSVLTIYSGSLLRDRSLTEEEELLRLLARHCAPTVINAVRFRSEESARHGIEALIDAVPVGIFGFNTETGELLSINAEGARLVQGALARGDTTQEFVDFFQIQMPEGQVAPSYEHPIARSIDTRSSIMRQRLIVGNSAGGYFPAFVSTIAVQSETEGDTLMAILVEDVSEIQGAMMLPGDLLRAVRNLLRRPLTTMKGSTVAALSPSQQQDPAETRHLIRLVDEQLNSVRRIVNDLADIGEIESGSLGLDLQPVDLRDVIEEAVSIVRENGLRFAVELELATPNPRVLADKVRAIQFFSYLFAVIAENWPDSPLVRISATEDESSALVIITHEAGGNTPLVLTQLLDRASLLAFGQLGLDPDWEDLTMAICTGIVNAHGGEIWAEVDEENRSSRIVFTIPIAPEAGAGDTQPDHRAESAPREDSSILVIGQSQQVLLQVRDTLAGVGFNPTLAESSEEAERIAIVERPDLVLLDISLPQSEGLGLIRRIREILDCPIVFFSGPGGDQDISRAFEMGAYDYVSRPNSPSELIGRVKAAIHNRSFARSDQISTYERGELTIDYTERRVTVSGTQVRLTATEYRLLSELSLNGGRVLTNDQLLRRVWGAQSSTDTRILRTFIKNLRRKLGDEAQHPAYIFTEPRVGYRMERSAVGFSA